MRTLASTWALVAVVLAGPVRAEEPPLPGDAALTSDKQLKELSETALKRLVSGEVEGFEALKKHSADTGGGEALDRYFRSQADKIKGFVRRYGKPLEQELVVEQRVRGSFCRFVYLCKYEKSFLRFVFTYYRPKDAWIFFRVDFDDDVGALFDDAARGGPTP